MKKLSLLLLSLCFTLRMAAAGEGKSLVILFDNGTTQTFLLAEKPEVSVADDKLVVTTSVATTQYTLADVLSFSFAETSGIDGVMNNPDIVRNGDTLLFSSPVNVEAFTADGKAVSIQYTKSGSGTAVSLKSLPSGVTIIKAAGRNIKIIR